MCFFFFFVHNKKIQNVRKTKGTEVFFFFFFSCVLLGLVSISNINATLRKHLYLISGKKIIFKGEFFYKKVGCILCVPWNMLKFTTPRNFFISSMTFLSIPAKFLLFFYLNQLSWPSLKSIKKRNVECWKFKFFKI